MLLAGILASSQFFPDLLLSRREKERIDLVILRLDHARDGGIQGLKKFLDVSDRPKVIINSAHYGIVTLNRCGA